jgi:LCP family protein required for cell wall assembly
MLSEIEREPDLSQKAFLLKEYLKGDVDLLNLSKFLRREIESSTSETWTVFCREIQSWVRAHFDAPDSWDTESDNSSTQNSPLLKLSQVERRSHLEDCEKNPSLLQNLLSPNSELTHLLEQDPESLKALLRALKQGLQQQNKKRRGTRSLQSSTKESPPSLDLAERFSNHFRVVKVFLVAVHSMLEQGLKGGVSYFRQGLNYILVFLKGAPHGLKKLLLKLADLERKTYQKILRVFHSWGKGFANFFGKIPFRKIAPAVPIGLALIWIFTLGPMDSPKDLRTSLSVQGDPILKEGSGKLVVSQSVNDETTVEDGKKEGFSSLLGELESFRSSTSVTLSQGTSDFILLGQLPEEKTYVNAELEIRSPKKILKKEARIELSLRPKKLETSVLSLPNFFPTQEKSKKSSVAKSVPLTAIQKAEISSQTVPQIEKIKAESVPVLAKVTNATPLPSDSSLVSNTEDSVSEKLKVSSESSSESNLESSPILKSTPWVGQSRTVLIVGKEKYGRADTVILSRIDGRRSRIRLLSLPRDLRVKIKHLGEVVQDKLSHTLRWGQVKLLQETLSTALGFPIDYYLQIDLALFKKLIDVIGGVALEVESDFHYVDKAGGLAIHLDKGYQLLNGSNAEGYVRFRGDGKGDLGRIQRQQKFIRVFLKKIKTLKSISWENLKVLARLPGFLVDVIKEIKSDIPPSMYIEFLRAYAQISHKDIHFKTIAGHAEYIHVGKKKPISFYISGDREVDESRAWLLGELGSESKKQLVSMKPKKGSTH